jgi:two-component system, sensor histidine kinase PdtaS
VHHRVKNNLQIISSLISLHWRAAEDPVSARCYLSIQRRVDALAVVQRNHYAELDEGQGVRARPMLNEIASSLRTSAQVQSGADLDIAVDCDDVSLHQDVAAPLAFMTAELADLVIALESDGQLRIALVRLEDQPQLARFALSSPAFRKARTGDGGKVELYERVLTGLSRQLRSPLEHDAAKGEYHVIAPIIS